MTEETQTPANSGEWAEKILADFQNATSPEEAFDKVEESVSDAIRQVKSWFRKDEIERLQSELNTALERVKELEEQNVMSEGDTSAPLMVAAKSIYDATHWMHSNNGDNVPDNYTFGGGLVWGQIRALRTAVEIIEPERDYETAWLIERDDPDRSPAWWGVDEGEPAWTQDHMYARRFGSKDEAEKEASDLGLDDWFASEHAWVTRGGRRRTYQVIRPPESDAESDTHYGIHDEWEPRAKCTCDLCEARAVLQSEGK